MTSDREKALQLELAELRCRARQRRTDVVSFAAALHAPPRSHRWLWLLTAAGALALLARVAV